MANCQEKLKIAVFTGTRAEYGLLRPVIKKILASEDLQLLMLVSGAHLKEEYGMTVREIEADGVPIAEKIDILLFGDDLTKTVPYAVEKYSEWLKAAHPDAIVILGDRYEAFAAAQAAALCRVPIAHISGGDVTLGAADEWYRHCITKMAALHFPSCEDSYNRLLRMGEEPSRVFNVGGLGDENIRSVPLLSEAELSQNLGFSLKEPFALVTFHPETANGSADAKTQMSELLLAMKNINEKLGLRYLITKSNADAGGSDINGMIDRFAKENSTFTAAFTSLGLRRYLSAMSLCSMVLGNSSSGVVETPSFKVPCVNVGNRQQGRIICQNVICCDCSQQSIEAAMEKALSDEFKTLACNTVSPYFGQNTSGDIVNILQNMLQSGELSRAKEFYDYTSEENR